MKTPVAFFIFNRPETTQTVFEAIREARPEKLFVIADGPRASAPYDPEKCAATRQIIETIDWRCEVIKNYSASNLGCKKRIASGLDWVFQSAEESIILEDDCLPHPSFFPFCEELLAMYREDTRVMCISGSNYQMEKKRTGDSYYFSRYSHCWGWASWKRAWKFYDLEMKLWPELSRSPFLIDLLGDKRAVGVWQKVFQATFEGKVDTWDYQWTFCCWKENGLTIIPALNLVSNIGFGTDAVHTKDRNNPHLNMPKFAMTFPLRHPLLVTPNVEADRFTQNTLYDYNPSLFRKFLRKIKKLAEK